MVTKVLMRWERPLWLNSKSMNKSLKKLYHTAKSFNADITLIDLDGELRGLGYDSNFNIVESLDEVLKEDELYILLEPLTAMPEVDVENLNTFKHPEEAVYVIWSDYGTIPFDMFKNKKFVSIKTEENTTPLWSEMALCILLYDRWNK